MDLLSILGELDAASGNQRILSISTNSERFVLPVTPWKINVTLGQDNKTVDILDSGEMLVFGNRKLHRLKFSCFFPDLSHKYPYVVDNSHSPRECIEILNRMKTDAEAVHVILTESTINQYFGIGEISYKMQDGSGDIYYEIELIESRDFVLPESNYTKKVNSLTGLKDRAGIRDSDALSSFLVNSSKDIADAVKAITGKTVSTGGNHQALGDAINVYTGITTGNINATTISSGLRIIKNPVGSLKSAVKSVGSIAKSAVKGIGKIFGF